MARIYLSVTNKDVKSYRDAVYRMLHRFIEGLCTSPAIKKVLKRSVKLGGKKRFASVVEFCAALDHARKSSFAEVPEKQRAIDIYPARTR